MWAFSVWCVKEMPYVGEEGLLQHVAWCGARGGLSTLAHVRAAVCKNCLAPNCAAQVRSYVAHARSA